MSDTSLTHSRANETPIEREVARRRTFAIISHPDAGKTTLTERLLLYGGAMIRFAHFRGRVHPKWWLGWHLNAVCALFNAVNGTILFVAARFLHLAEDTAIRQARFQLLTIAVALGLRALFGRKFRAPLRFGPAPTGRPGLANPGPRRS